MQFTEAVVSGPVDAAQHGLGAFLPISLSQHGAIEAETTLPDTADTLAEYLKATGYHTVDVTWHDFVDRKHGFAQRFDVFVEHNKGGARSRPRC